jgi:hypothetical protein
MYKYKKKLMKNIKLLKLNIIKIINNSINKLFIVFTINKSPFKNGYFGILLLIGIITSLIIRLDYIVNLLHNLPYELMVSLRLTSALYSILLLFLLVINIKQFKDFYKHYFKLENKKISILILYNLKFSYFSIVSLIIFIINYYSIISLNILYLDIIYLSLSFISLITGIYYSIYKFNSEFDLNRTLSLTGKITFFSFILIYLSLFIGIRTGIIIEWFKEYELFEKIYCESSNPNNLNSRLRNGEDGTISTITNNSGSNIGNRDSNSLISSINNTGDSATVSNVTINPASNNTPVITATITTTLTRTETINTSVNGLNNNIPSSQDLTPPVYTSNNPNNNYLGLLLSQKGKEAFGIFNKWLKSNSLQISTTSSLTSPLIIDPISEEDQFVEGLLNKKSNDELKDKISLIENKNNNPSIFYSQDIINNYLNIPSEDNNQLLNFDKNEITDLDELLKNNRDLFNNEINLLGYNSDNLEINNLEILINDSYYDNINYIYNTKIKPIFENNIDKKYSIKIISKIKKDSFWNNYSYILKNYKDKNINVYQFTRFIKLLIDSSIEQYSRNKYLIDYDLDECLNLQLLAKNRLIYYNGYFSCLINYTKNNHTLYKYIDFMGFNDYQFLSSINDLYLNESNLDIKEFLAKYKSYFLIRFYPKYLFEYKEILEPNYLNELTVKIIQENNKIFWKLYHDDHKINRLIFLEKLRFFAYFSLDENKEYNFEIIHCDSLIKLRHLIKMKEVKLFNEFQNICNEEGIDFIVIGSNDKKLDINYINKLHNELYIESKEKLKYIIESYIKLTNIQSVLQKEILGLNTKLPENNQDNLFN